MEEIFMKVREAVIGRTGVQFDDMVSSNKDEHVDARSLFVCLLHEYGLTDTRIGVYIGMTRQGVNKLRNNFHDRKKGSWVLSTTWQRLRDELAIG